MPCKNTNACSPDERGENQHFSNIFRLNSRLWGRSRPSSCSSVAGGVLEWSSGHRQKEASVRSSVLVGAFVEQLSQLFCEPDVFVLSDSFQAVIVFAEFLNS
jgi:hypothetical protein